MSAPAARSCGAYGLSRRDLQTLGWISEQYAVRMDELAVLLGRSERTAQRFARRCRAGGLVHAQPVLAGEPTLLWLTGAGRRMAATDFSGWSVRIGLLAHISAVNRVRLYVAERSPGCEWVCERRLAQDLPRGRHLPDGVVQTDGARHAVEVELTPKSHRRLEAIITELSEGYDAVVYFTTPATRRQLERVDATERWPKLAIRSIPDLPGAGRET
jgi:DNA-binding MarR family transcriptional regulator